ncbi:hypothetical protein IX317_001099 [Fusobacterium sp. DD29]|uniref:hypothetical protein n=1 Tax=unclassified Fusobacterium TaxID=2648384 RepID=UPI001B8AC6C1|nr:MULTISPECIES: hypothetical protein [unclassified Fusobacterium]MBR8749425.1 hypothetical protein [Fusobacterium sp. DD29]MBR8761685.1 hypothetical protein [Fusobacterium sp. DD25]MBR8767725.1 hypothetical protein [Fusobacterium sp. DD43]MBR8771727.1 hypothetical protein [Fusobacterium sp. DD40]MBR8776001.1 hypothetical protein [Fusobacterium sp. DD17]
MTDIIFSKEQVLKQFNTNELLAEIVTRKEENLDKLIETYLIAGVILKGKLRIGDELKQEIIEKLKGYSVD